MFAAWTGQRGKQWWIGVSLGKLNSNGCSLGNPGQLSIGVIGDHSGTVLRAYSKHAETGLAIEAEILASNRVGYWGWDISIKQSWLLRMRY